MTPSEGLTNPVRLRSPVPTRLSSNPQRACKKRGLQKSKLAGHEDDRFERALVGVAVRRKDRVDAHAGSGRRAAQLERGDIRRRRRRAARGEGDGGVASDTEEEVRPRAGAEARMSASGDGTGAGGGAAVAQVRRVRGGRASGADVVRVVSRGRAAGRARALGQKNETSPSGRASDRSHGAPHIRAVEARLHDNEMPDAWSAAM